MKKIVYLFLAVFIVFSFISCEEEDGTTPTPKIPTAEFFKTTLDGVAYYSINIHDTGENVEPEFFVSFTNDGVWQSAPFEYYGGIIAGTNQGFRIPTSTYPTTTHSGPRRFGFRLTFIESPHTSSNMIYESVSNFTQQ